jgi:hypothetical protein
MCLEVDINLSHQVYRLQIAEEEEEKSFAGKQ